MRRVATPQSAQLYTAGTLAARGSGLLPPGLADAGRARHEHQARLLLERRALHVLEVHLLPRQRALEAAGAQLPQDTTKDRKQSETRRVLLQAP